MAWVAGLATIGAVEFMAAAVALFILRRLQVANNYRLWRQLPLISLVIFYDRRLWLCRQAYVHEHSPVDVYANTKLTWPTTLYPLNCLKKIFIIFIIILWHALARPYMLNTVPIHLSHHFFYFNFPEGIMSLEAIDLSVNAVSLAHLIILFIWDYIQTEGERDDEKRRKFKRWKDRAM